MVLPCKPDWHARYLTRPQIESLPTKTNDEQPLQNILSISTAGRNRYLLHFNSHHSLVQWTSGIRLAMFEHSTLQEAYTGALIAGKGKTLNNINIIMERARQPIQEWVRVRFGAGVPWKRCYCVIEPPSEKEYQKAQKEHKKRSPYDRSHGPVLKGEIKFFDTKKEADKKKKHQRPIASITDAYSAYAIYPQAKELIDSSTLLKLEGNITIHTDPASSSEGFVFIMPETPPAVSGFEMLLRFLFPTWDTFALYGRPGRLVASTLDTRSLMFAMPKNRRYGYLDVLDVTGLITTDGSPSWSEREWRKRLKDLTGQRKSAMEDAPESASRSTSRNSKRLSYGAQNPISRPRVGFADDGGSVRSSRSMSVTRPGMRNDSAPPDPNRERAPSAMAGHSRHSRHVSDTQIGDTPPGFGLDNTPPAMRSGLDRVKAYASGLASTPERVSSEDDSPVRGPMGGHLEEMKRMETPEPVNAPPAFAHSAGSRPQQKPNPSPEMRRATNRLSNTTLSQLANAGGLAPDTSDELHFGTGSAGPGPGHTDQRGLAVQPQTSANAVGMNANFNGSREVLTSPTAAYASRNAPAPPAPLRDPARKRSNSPLRGPSTEPAGDIPTTFRPAPHGGPPPGGRRTPPPGQNLAQQFSPDQGSSPPIHRKPLPSRTTSLSSNREQNHAGSPVSPESPLEHFPLPGSGTRFRSPNEFSPPPIPAQGRYRQNGPRVVEASFDDASSTASPDYASTRRSSDTQESVDRPRAGVLKVVGTDSADSSSAALNKDYDIPEINFGRTLNYGAPILPDAKTSSKESPRPAPPASGRKSPGLATAFSHFRQSSDDTVRRSVVWPGPATGSSSSDNLASLQLSFQQRAAATPQYAHQRIPSTNTLTDVRPSHSRHSSVDLLASGRPLGQSHSRHSSADLLASGRPASRGTTAVLSGAESHKRPGSRNRLHSRNSSADLLASGRPVSQGTAAAFSAGEVSSYLSAREQEHVARVTGGPLIPFAGSKGPSQTQGGLVGAIESRERERAQMRQGIGGQAVAQAIDQRHREQNQQAQRAAQVAYAQQQAQFAAQQAQVRPQTPGAMGMMMGGGAPSPYGPPQGHARPQTPGAMSRMMDGAGAPSPYGAPSMAGMNPRGMSPGPGMMSPGHYGQGIPPQQQRAPQMMPQTATYDSGWNMPHRQGGPVMPSPSMGFGMQGGGRPQSPAYQLPPQGQYAPPGTPGGPRPGTPGRMQFHGQAF